MNQFIVEKPNRHNFNQWASRVLTVDPDERCFYLSRKDDVNDITYHKVLLSKVYFWPDVGRAYTMNLKSSIARATIRLRGREVTAAQGDAARVEQTTRPPAQPSNPFSPQRPSEGAEKGAPPPAPPPAPGPRPDGASSSERGARVEWLLRLSSEEEVPALKGLLLSCRGCVAEGKATYVLRGGDDSPDGPPPTAEAGKQENDATNTDTSDDNNAAPSTDKDGKQRKKKR